MKICHPSDISAFLCDVPPEFRDGITAAISLVMSEMDDDEATCEGIKKCETLTSLSPFTLSGNILAISFKDEKSVIYTRTVDITGAIGSILVDVDPKCLMTQEEWDSLTLEERIQSVIDSYCNCCHPTTTTTSTSTTTSSSTTTTTTVPPCVTYEIVYPEGDGEEVEFTYNDCDGNPHTISLGPGESITFCAISGTVVYPNDLVLIFEDSECVTCCNITDVTADVDTSPSCCLPSSLGDYEIDEE